MIDCQTDFISKSSSGSVEGRFDVATDQFALAFNLVGIHPPNIDADFFRGIRDFSAGPKLFDCLFEASLRKGFVVTEGFDGVAPEVLQGFFVSRGRVVGDAVFRIADVVIREEVNGRSAALVFRIGRTVNGIEEAAEEAVIGHPGLDVPVIFFGRVGNSAFFAKEFFPKFRSAGIDVQFPNSGARDLDGARIGGILFEIVRGDATSIEV